MNKRLAYFNPEHDLALANNDPHFNVPISALRFAKDLQMLPIWYFDERIAVIGKESDAKWLSSIQYVFPSLCLVDLIDQKLLSRIEELKPWGWNQLLVSQFIKKGLANNVLLDEYGLQKIRELSHRQTAIQVHSALKEVKQLYDIIPPPAQILQLNEVVSFVEKEGNAVFKAPWSGSGKGLCWAKGGVSDSIYGWCRNTIAKQGAVIAEKAYDKIQDFALLFESRNKEIVFSGYSLFTTEKGTYRSNELMSNSCIIEKLIEKGASYDQLSFIKRALTLLLENEIAPLFNGTFGVDMFLYQEGNQVKIHPCVEINFRLTMGYVARKFFDRFVEGDSYGKLYIDHFLSSEQLVEDHILKTESFPLILNNGRIRNGYLSLNPIDEFTRSRARVEIVEMK